MSSGQVGGPSPVITAGGATSTASTGVGAKSTSLSALQEIEEAYNKRLDLDVNQLMESFSDIIKVASVSESQKKKKKKTLHSTWTEEKAWRKI